MAPQARTGDRRHDRARRPGRLLQELPGAAAAAYAQHSIWPPCSARTSSSACSSTRPWRTHPAGASQRPGPAAPGPGHPAARPAPRRTGPPPPATPPGGGEQPIPPAFLSDSARPSPPNCLRARGRRRRPLPPPRISEPPARGERPDSGHAVAVHRQARGPLIDPRRRRQGPAGQAQREVHLRDLRHRLVATGSRTPPRSRSPRRRPRRTTRCSSTATPAWARPTCCTRSATTRAACSPARGCGT